MSGATGSLSQGAAWGALVSTTQSSKLPLLQHPTAVYVTGRATSARHRWPVSRVNPVLQRARDASEEAAWQESTAQRATLRANAGRDRQALFEATHDIITARPRLPERPRPVPVRLTNSFASGSSFDIVAPSVPVPDALLTAAARAPPKPLPVSGRLISHDASHLPRHARRRAVDLITNRYTKDDEARQARDAAAERAAVLERFRRASGGGPAFNPLTQSFRDDARAEAALRAAEATRRAPGRRLTEPPVTACRVGAVYDIVRHVPRAGVGARGVERALAMVDAMDARPLRRLTRRADHEADVAARAAAAAAAAERRSLSRASVRRLEEGTTTHGYNVVTNAVADAHALDKAFAARPRVTAWDRIAADLEFEPRAGTAPAGALARHAGGWTAEGQ